jgi:hypothetical protein
MQTSKWKGSYGGAVLTGALLSCCVFSQAAATPNSDAQSNYRQEKASCLNGTSNEDKKTCLKEANAALAEAKRGRLDMHQQTNYQQNALARCERLPMEDRDACQHRINGDGTITGSVAAGGLYREYREIVPAPAEPSVTVPPKPGEMPTETPTDTGQ